MSQSVTVVGIGTVDLAKEISREQKRQEIRKTFKAEAIPDSFEGKPSPEVCATAGECSAPTKSTKDAHEVLKGARARLADSVRQGFKDLGRNVKTDKVEAHLEESFNEVVAGIEREMLKGGESGVQGKSEGKLAKFEKLLSQLTRSQEEFVKARQIALTAEGESLDSTNVDHSSIVPGVKGAGEGNLFDRTQPQDEEWKQLEGLGLVGPDKDIEKVGAGLESLKKARSLFSKELKNKEGELKSARKGLAEFKKKGSPPEVIQEAEKKCQELEAVCQEFRTKESILKEATTKGNFIYEQIVRQQAAADLGVEPDVVNARQEPVRKEAEGSQTQDRSRQSMPATVRTASVSNRGADRRTSTTELHTSSTPQNTQDNSSEFVASTSAVGVAAANDFSGTTLSIASTTNQLQTNYKSNERIIKNLLLAVRSGNWEACKTCMLFLDKSANLIRLGLGARVIISMQAFEKTMVQLSGSLGKLTGKEADYNARLAKLNSDINMLSQNRLAASNFLRDGFTMVEEVISTTRNIYQRDQEIVGLLAR